jgi:hypothetical protein
LLLGPSNGFLKRLPAVLRVPATFAFGFLAMFLLVRHAMIGSAPLSMLRHVRGCVHARSPAAGGGLKMPLHPLFQNRSFGCHFPVGDFSASSFSR